LFWRNFKELPVSLVPWMMAIPSPIFSITLARRAANSTLGSASVKSGCAAAGSAAKRTNVRAHVRNMATPVWRHPGKNDG